MEVEVSTEHAAGSEVSVKAEKGKMDGWRKESTGNFEQRDK